MIKTDSDVMVTPLNKLREVIMRRAVKHGHFKLSAGGESTYYIDCRKMSLAPDGMAAIGQAIVTYLSNAEIVPDIVCGPESAGIPVVSAVVSYYERYTMYLVEGAFVRKEIKEHGTRSPIEGCDIKDSSKVLMVEDVATSGTSLLKAITAVQQAGAVVVAAVVLVDRLQGAREKIEQLGVPYRAMLTVNDLGLE